MQIRGTVAVLLSVWLMLPPGLQAQEPQIADPATLDQAVAAHAQRVDADRQTIRRMLERQQVREIAARARIDIKRAERAIATLEGPELQEIAAQARVVDASLAGGASSVTISTTTIIIGLLVLILIIVAVN
jgi:hypothetical protein